MSEIRYTKLLPGYVGNSADGLRKWFAFKGSNFYSDLDFWIKVRRTIIGFSLTNAISNDQNMSLGSFLHWLHYSQNRTLFSPSICYIITSAETLR